MLNSEQKENLNSGLENDNSDELHIKIIYPKAKPLPKIFQIKNEKEQNEKNNDVYELNQEFLSSLLQPVFTLDKDKMINTISKIMNNSKLSKKIEKETEIKENINSLYNAFIQSLTFMKIEKDKILYHIGETDEKFYFIIKGKISELKAFKYHRILPFDDYISYLIELKKNNEKYILSKVLADNKNEIPIKSEEDIKRIQTIIFKKKLLEKISLETISNNTELEQFFKEYYQDFSDYKMTKKELEKLGKNKNKIIMGSVNREWDDYILEKCHMNSDEAILFEPFEEVFAGKKHSYSVYLFENTGTYGESNYFGDFSLEEEKIKREETIRADEETFLGWITNDDYISIISPARKMEKKKEIMLLNNGYFFKNISERTFKRNYYNMFIKKECSMNTVLFNTGAKPKSLIFIKQGKISLVLNCSIIELYNLIQLIYIKLNKVTWPFDYFQKKILTKEKLRAIESKYFNEPIFKKIKTFNKIFKFELEKKRKFQISVFSDLEIIGLEEIYLKIPHIAKGIVISDKIVYYELPVDRFNKICQDEMRNITESYVIVVMNRILSLMERFHNLKQNYINIAKIKSESANSENNNNSNSINTFKEPNKESSKKYYKYKYISSLDEKKLKINNSKTKIPQNFITKRNDENIVKTEGNFLDNSIPTTARISSTRVKVRRNSSLIRKRTNRMKTVMSKKIFNHLKSANKTRDNKFELEKNTITNRAGSVKLKDLLPNKKKEEVENTPNKRTKSIIIGNNIININKLRRTLDEYNSFAEIRKNFEEEYLNESRSLNESKDINILFSNDNDYIKIKEVNKKKLLYNEKTNEINRNKKLSPIKRDSQENSKSIIKITENYNKNDSDSQISKLKINNIRLLINPISPMSIKSINVRNFKNIKPLNLTVEKQIINKKLISSNNTYNNATINQTLNPNLQNNINMDTSSSELPKISQRAKYIDYLKKTTNIYSNQNNFNKNKANNRIPEIVKEYYSQIRKKGCIPLITNKESNTIFLRKFHKKYKDIREERVNKSPNKIGKILPKINEKQTKNFN